MSGGSPREWLDPLRSGLARAQANGHPVHLLCQLRAQDSPDQPTPEETARLAESALARASASSGLAPARHQVLRHLAMLRVEADAAFLLELLAQPEVHFASMADHPDIGAEIIRPIRRGPATDSGWAKPE